MKLSDFIFFNSHHSFVIQVEKLLYVRYQLCFSGLCSEVQPLPSQRAGPELQQAAGFRSEAAVWFSGEFSLQTGDSEVSSLTLCYSCFSHRLRATGNFIFQLHLPPADVKVHRRAGSKSSRLKTYCQHPEK